MMITIDVTNQLTSHVYLNSNDDKILCHCDHVFKFNNSITHIIDDLYLMKYRAWYYAAIPESVEQIYEKIKPMIETDNIYDKVFELFDRYKINDMLLTYNHDIKYKTDFQFFKNPDFGIIQERHNPRKIVDLFIGYCSMRLYVIQTKEQNYIEISQSIMKYLCISFIKSNKSFIPEFYQIISKIENVELFACQNMNYLIINNKLNFYSNSFVKKMITIIGEWTNVEHDDILLMRNLINIKLKVYHEYVNNNYIKSVSKYSTHFLHPSQFDWRYLYNDETPDLQHNGNDIIGFSILKIDGSITVIKDMLFVEHIKMAHDGKSISLVTHSHIGDSRIIKRPSLSKNKSKSTFRFWMSNDCNTPLQMCHGGFLLRTTLRDFATSRIIFYDRFDLSTNRICSAQYGQMKGRNWSMWIDKSIKFSTQFLPHITLTPNFDFQQCESKKNEIIPIDDNYVFNETYKFSLGTPAIPYNDTEYIAVGHSRFNIKNDKYDFLNTLYGNSPFVSPNFTAFLEHVYKNKEKYILHKFNFYFMYFYTFDKNTHKITKMSHSFIPPNNRPSLLVFPAGIVQMPSSHTFIISYGEGDARSKLLFIDRSMIESLLHPIEEMVNNNDHHEFLLFE
jgi:hypothetical protein